MALVGGGSHPRPGEISLAHHGVLFLDELPEFDRRVLEVLREPLESGTITVSRAAQQSDFPARVQLIAAMNPCPCGYLGDPSGRCHCSPEQVRRYRSKISGPLLDRIDMSIEVPNIPKKVLLQTAPEAETSALVRERVRRVRARQLERAGKPSSRLGLAEIERDCRLRAGDRRLFGGAIERLGLSPARYTASSGWPAPSPRLAGLEVIETRSSPRLSPIAVWDARQARSVRKACATAIDPVKCALCQMPITASQYAPRPPTSRSSPSPEANQFVFAYTITIENTGTLPAKLMTPLDHH